MKTTFPTSLKSGLTLGCLISVLGLVSASASPTVKVLRGGNQQTSYGAQFPAPLVVWATDPATERAVSGLRVEFTPAAGIGLSSSFAITDDRGLASVTATGLATGTSSVSAVVNGIPNLKMSFDGLEVDKAVLTVVPVDIWASRDEQLPQATAYIFTGLVNGDTAESARITGTPVLTTTAKNQSPHANYAIKGNVGTLAAPNYTFVAGFGTLAILDGPNDGPKSDAGEQILAISASPSEEDAVSVRSALQPNATPLPAFLAGLRGQSGVFVVNAMWPDSVSAPTPQILYTRTALTAKIADTRPAQEAPVRPVELAQAV
ncbi:MAG TPA: MBG domain-containing protein, partial [Acidobacteriaceae bacterium]|nr:MBG domain-containing protein [Acidobacteriaceae bacterium]